MRRLFLALIAVSSVALAERRTTPLQSPFELAKAQYERGRYARSIELFGQAIASNEGASVRTQAYYYQGLAMLELGLYYSSFTAFQNVFQSGDTSNKAIYEKAIRNAVSVGDRLDMVDRLGKSLEALPSGVIPPSVNSHAHYAIGAHYFNSGDDKKAAANLKSVGPESPYHAKASFLLGVISTRSRSYSEAMTYFDRAVQSSGREKSALRELARLNLARSAYSAGQVEKSIELYSQFTSASPHWLTILLEASWPLLRVNDTTVSLGNLHTVLSPFYQEDLVGEGYVLRATILFSLCKYEEMRQTLAQFFAIYDPLLRSMQAESNSLGNDYAYYEAFSSGKGLNKAFANTARRDEGVSKLTKVIELLRRERRELAAMGRGDGLSRMGKAVEEAIVSVQRELGKDLRKLHARKLKELVAQREQANYLKVEIVTGEKELIEGQKGLPAKRVVDVETSVGENYHFWPYIGEYWEDELGAYVYTTESSCVN